LHGRKIPSGGAVELLLLRRIRDRTWEVIVGGRRVQAGIKLQIEGGPEATILEDLGFARRIVEFTEPVSEQLIRYGEMPTPPYIYTPIENADEYQTVFAQVPGSSAAPTAGLHFTDRLLAEIREQGIKIAKVSLQSPTEHQIHQEWCQVSDEVANRINEARSNGGRVIAVGTTSVRSLETAVQEDTLTNRISPYQGNTSLYILPGYTFRAVDSIITNFHLPHSTLLMMISAFTGRDQLLSVYEEAIKLKYRFYSFGDAMLIL
jgi:S-adenosylmethionine:tRNA ribosyltransferase-isomerase